MTARPTKAVVEKVGARIAWRRRMVGLTQQDVAARLGLYRTQVTHMEQGRSLSLRLDVLAALAHALYTYCISSFDPGYIP